MFRAQNVLRAALVIASLALVFIPAAAQAGGGCHPKFHGGCHTVTHCQPTFCQPTYCQPSYCHPVVTCRPVVVCQPIFVQPVCKPICQPYFPSCKPVIIYKW
jgi:hypothetical protein